MRLSVKLIAGTLVILWGTVAGAQSVVSAKNALVHYIEGKVFLTQRPERPKFNLFHLMLDRDVLDTESGRAEVLLTPEVFLRLDEHSSMRLLSGQITDSSVQLLKGTFALEALGTHRGEPVTLTCGGTTITIAKPGICRVDVAPAGVRVFGGQVLVRLDRHRMTIGKGQALLLDGSWLKRKFDRARIDPFDLWSRHRSELLAITSPGAGRDPPVGGNPDDLPVLPQPPRRILSR